MSKLRFQGDTSGYIDLEVPAVASNKTINLDEIPQLNSASGDTFIHSSGKFEIRDSNGYARVTAYSGSAQLGLFRQDAQTVGGMYIGADWDEFRLYDSSFNIRMSVTQDGYVTMPYQPAFHVTGLSAHLYASTGEGVISTWLNTNLNRGGHWNGSRWTVPTGGTYLVQFDPMYQHNGGDITFQILVNGVQKAYNNPHTKDSGGYYPPWHNAPINWMGELNSGDYVEFSWSSGGSASTFIYSGGLYTRAWGYRLG